MGLDTTEVAEMLLGVNLLSKSDNIRYFDRANSSNVYSVAQTANRIWLDQKYIETSQNINNLIIRDFIEE